MRWPFLLLALFAIATPSCLEDSSSEAKIQDLKDEIYDLKQDATDQAEEAEERVSSAESKAEKSKQALLSANTNIDSLTEELNQSNSLLEQSRKSARDSHQVYLDQLADCAKGLKIDSIKADGKTYQNAQIVGVIPEGLKIRHQNGITTLAPESTPSEWRPYLPRWAPDSPSAKPSSLSSSSSGSSKNSPANSDVTSNSPANSESTSPAKEVKLTDPEKAVVVIEGDKSSGTGFIIYTGSQVYLYTAAHVLSGNKKLTFKTKDGKEYKRFGRLEVATDVDMARMQMLDRVPAALRLPTKAGEASPGKEIVAYGNSGGGSVITKAEGSIQGVGAESLEIDAKIIQGNSGGPVVLNNTNTVAGIVTHAINPQTDVWASGTRYSQVRRFAARLDRRITWKRISLTNFLAEPDKIKKLNQITRLLFALAALEPTPNGMRLTRTVNGTSTALSILRENADMKAVKALIKMNSDLQNKKIKPDPGQTRNKFISFYRGILDAAASQTREASNMSPFHKEIAKGYMGIRKEARAAVIKRLKTIGG